MAITNVLSVASMYPTFQRGPAQQKPTDAFIQQIADDIASRIIAVLQRRFGEAIAGAASLSAWLESIGIPTRTWAPGTAFAVGDTVADPNIPIGIQQVTVAGTTGTTLPNWNTVIGGTTTDNTVTWKNTGQTMQFQVLEQINRYGAAFQFGKVLASFNIVGTAQLADHYEKNDWKPAMDELNSVNPNGRPKPFGAFDVLFDPQANISSPRPGMLAIAGGDQDPTQAANQEGLAAIFSKFGVDYGPSALAVPNNNPLAQGE